ncbi:hypothetical protein ASF09_04885 [Sphingomonas sp. Leaf242]|nr:hypothetical protein ASF09_04885 [Sphingomonas sp. Leaf242]
MRRRLLLFESGAIIYHIANAHGDTLRPADPRHERAGSNGQGDAFASIRMPSGGRGQNAIITLPKWPAAAK